MIIQAATHWPRPWGTRQLRGRLLPGAGSPDGRKVTVLLNCGAGGLGGAGQRRAASPGPRWLT